ncbi:GGDEF domain-containing protein [Halomonadaceae bacterium KBTZ08]
MPEAFQQYPDDISLASLLEHARHNEQIARNLFEIEREIMGCRDCAAFLDRLTDRIRERFDLDEVWLVLTDVEANRPLFSMLADDRALTPVVSAPAGDYLHLTGGSQSPLLIPNSLGYQRLIPDGSQAVIGSMAILPLVVDDRLAGGLVLGSRTTGRYSPDMDAFFLEQLAVKASLGLDSTLAREQLRRLATRDALTGLRNRREMETVLQKELSRSRRYQLPLSLLFIDCDGFKAINDHYGHECGDAYLCHLGETLRRLLREDDSVFRFAGDEFVVVLPNQSVRAATHIGARLQEGVAEEPLIWEGHRIPLAFSVGVAGSEQTGLEDSRALLRYADQRLYEQKRER